MKKMVTKGYIVKETGLTDARTTVVTLSDLGRETVKKKRNNMYRQIGAAIDKVGMERLIEFTAVLKEISSVLSDLQ